MPFCLEEIDVGPEIANSSSALIVPCRFCPAASMAVKSNEPYIEFPRRLLKTAAYERLIADMKAGFEEKGVKTQVFESHLLHQFVLCMWTAGRRKKLLETAKNFEAVVVMGCEAAVETVRSCLESASCRIIQGMKAEGIMSIQPKLSLPCTLSLELEGVTPYVSPSTQAAPMSEAR